jgi:hypothetical protein
MLKRDYTVIKNNQKGLESIIGLKNINLEIFPQPSNSVILKISKNNIKESFNRIDSIRAPLEDYLFSVFSIESVLIFEMLDVYLGSYILVCIE